jgi:ubiquinone/menaquinone biosynthesis C-methylase UbiE
MANIDRGIVGRTPRLRSLTLESQQDFVSGFKSWMDTRIYAGLPEHTTALLKRHGLQTEGAHDIPCLRPVLEGDVNVAVAIRVWISIQRLMWRSLDAHYSTNSEFYLRQLASFDDAGPGSLELDPELHVPDWARHEIHIMPGGYVGNDFAGAFYHYGTKSFYRGGNDDDEIHVALAKRVARPFDGRVKRVVDVGCGIGQLTLALKSEFPDALVSGLDVAAPLLRYAHMRGVSQGVDVHFAQRLAQATRLPDGSIDVATAYILFHETPTDVAREVCAEMFRVLRPGGVFDVTDFDTGPRRRSQSAFRAYRAWADHHYNGERWSQQFLKSDFLEMLREAGFDASIEASKHSWQLPAYVARKPA